MPLPEQVTTRYGPALVGVAAGVAGVVVMVLVAAVGSSLLDVDRLGTRTLVALATGATVSLSGGLPGGFLPVDVRAGLDAVPLGVTLAGLLTVAGVLAAVRFGRFRRPAALAGGVAVGFLGGIAVATAGTGAVGSAVVHGVGWLAALGGVVACLDGRLPLAVFRRAVVSVVAVVGGVAVVGTVLMAAFAGFTPAGRAGVGAALLAGPNAVLGGLTRALGVDWTVTTGGVAGRVLPSTRVGGVGGQLALDVPQGLLVAGVVVFVLLCALFTTPRTTATPRGEPVRAALRCGVALGVTLGVVGPILVALTRMSLRVDVALGGNILAGATIGLDGPALPAAVTGLLGGLVAGGVVGLVTELARRRGPVPAARLPSGAIRRVGR